MATKRIGVFAELPIGTVKEIGRRAKAASTKEKPFRIWQVIDKAIKDTMPANKATGVKIT